MTNYTSLLNLLKAYPDGKSQWAYLGSPERLWVVEKNKFIPTQTYQVAVIIKGKRKGIVFTLDEGFDFFEDAAAEAKDMVLNVIGKGYHAVYQGHKTAKEKVAETLDMRIEHLGEKKDYQSVLDNMDRKQLKLLKSQGKI